MLDSLFGSSESLRLLKVLEVELLLDFLLNALGLPSITLENSSSALIADQPMARNVNVLNQSQVAAT